MVCPKVTSLALAKSQPNANIWMALDARASGACVSVNNRLAASNAYRPQRPHARIGVSVCRRPRHGCFIAIPELDYCVQSQGSRASILWMG